MILTLILVSTILIDAKFQTLTLYSSYFIFLLSISVPIGDKRQSGLTPNELKIMQRILLELYCQYDHSLPFRELEPSTNATYYEIVCR